MEFVKDTVRHKGGKGEPGHPEEMDGKIGEPAGSARARRHHLEEKVEFKSPLRASMWDAWRFTSRDPEQCIGQWAREGVPFGMEQSIPDSNIFPTVDAVDSLEEKMDLSKLGSLRNCEWTRHRSK